MFKKQTGKKTTVYIGFELTGPHMGIYFYDIEQKHTDHISSAAQILLLPSVYLCGKCRAFRRFSAPRRVFFGAEAARVYKNRVFVRANLVLYILTNVL